jgi:MFS family permease
MPPMLSPAEASVRKHLRFNFAVGLLDGGFFGLGIGFGSFEAIIPLFVLHLTDSAFLIGMVPAIHNLGWQIPQLLTAGYLARLTRFKAPTLAMTIHERLPFLGLALVALAMSRAVDSPLWLVLTFVLLIWQGFGGGLAANPWTSLVTKVIPPTLHGTFFGAQTAAFSGLAGISALAASFILRQVAPPLGFALCFALTFLFMMLSFVFLALTREAASPPRAGSSRPLLGQSREVLHRDSNFRAFLGVRALSQFAGMGFAFYVIYAVRRFDASDATAAALVAILLIGQVVLSPVMGRLGDKWSHRGVMSLGALGAALSAVLAWQATSQTWFYAIFLLEAVAIVAIWTIPLALSVGFAPTEADRPLYIGLSNTLPAPAAILAPAVGGWIADHLGFSLMFGLSALCGLAMAILLWFVVKDPPPPSMRDASVAT